MEIGFNSYDGSVGGSISVEENPDGRSRLEAEGHVSSETESGGRASASIGTTIEQDREGRTTTGFKAKASWEQPFLLLKA